MITTSFAAASKIIKLDLKKGTNSHASRILHPRLLQFGTQIGSQDNHGGKTSNPLGPKTWTAGCPWVEWCHTMPCYHCYLIQRNINQPFQSYFKLFRKKTKKQQHKSIEHMI
jgi:hypothetical protein